MSEDKKKRPPRSSASTKLKAARVAAGLTQSEVAQRTGISIRMIQSYEQGTRSVDGAGLDIILKLSLAIGVPMGDILDSEILIKLLEEYGEMLASGYIK